MNYSTASQLEAFMMVANRPEMVCDDLVCHPKAKAPPILLANATDAEREIFFINRIVIPSIVIPVVTSGVLGNVIVIHVIRATAKLRTQVNVLIANLAVVGTVFLLTWGTFIVLHHGLASWPFGDVSCKAVHYFRYVTSYVTIYTLVAIAAVRYLTVVRTKWKLVQDSILRKRSVYVLICVLWMFFLLVNIPTLWITGESEEANATSSAVVWCDVLGDRLEEGRLLIVFSFVFGYLVPLVVITAFYILIVRHLAAKASSSTLQQTSARTHSQRRSRHLTEVFVMLVVTFAVCQLPLHLHLLLNVYKVIVTDSLVTQASLTLWYVLQFVNHALNPLIYSLNSSAFRKTLAATCCVPRCQGDFIPSSSN